jgi:WD40 repeat protein
LWDLERRRELARLVHSTSGAEIAFSAEGRYLATTDGPLVRVWRTDGAEVARVEHLSRVSNVAFSPRGDLLSFARVTPNGDNAIHFLPWRAEQLVNETCQRLTRNLDEAEWREYVGAEKYRKTCPNLP